ncbi:MAG: hypothetical protein J6U10_06610, partial [Lachnospiraceae bacterium]|nr:hypothetical protein [Lachnospiraceae bacterium]
MRLNDIFDGFDAGSYLDGIFSDFDVDKFVVSNSTSKAVFQMRLHKLISWRDVRDLENKLNAFLNNNSGITLTIDERYNVADMSVREIFDAYKSSIYEELSRDSVISSTILENCFELEEYNGVFNAKLRDSFLDRLFADRLKSYLRDVFKNRFDKDVTVNTEFSLDPPEQKEEFCDGPRERVSPSDSKPAAEPKKEAKKEPAANKSKDNAFKFKAKKLPPDPNLIFGKNFDGTPVSISAIQEEIGEAVVTGQAVSSEEKVIAKLNKVCCTFIITDFTDSIKVKLFVTPEAYEEFKTVYEDKKFYTVKGYVKYDEYDKELEISSVTGIKYAKDTRVKRFDDAPFKRVELHAHTKMSDMDAVTNPEDLV